MTDAAGNRTIHPKQILVVLPTWVGDFVMATPTLRAIRDRFKDARITFLMVPNLRELVAGGDWMDQVAEWPRRGDKYGLFAYLGLARRLRKSTPDGFDLAVLLPNSFKSALMAELAGARRRIGYDRDGRGILLTDRLAVSAANSEITPHPICGYYGRIATALGCEEPGDVLELFTRPACVAAIQQRLTSLGIAEHRPLVVISPGASFGASKLWLPERFAAVADRLIDSVDATVMVTCGPGEEPIARRIGGSMTKPGYVLDDPVMTLGELKALIKRADLLICNDAGPRHIAKAFSTPVVTVFGPTHQEWTDTGYARERKVSIPVDCGPCQLKTCPLEHHKCMTGVTADMVLDCCVELLEWRPTGCPAPSSDGRRTERIQVT